MQIRSGVVVARHGGMAPVRVLTGIGLDTRFGTGGQHWPWISLHDEAAAIRHLLTSRLSGPVNLVGPHPDRQVQVARERGRQLHRPAVLPAPAFGIRLVLGGFADEVLHSKRVVPGRLTESGFTHADTDVASALRWVLQQS